MIFRRPHSFAAAFSLEFGIGLGFFSISFLTTRFESAKAIETRCSL